MKKIIIVILVFFAGLFRLTGQEIGVAGWLGYTYQSFNSESFSNFIRTYNEINGPSLEKPFDEKFNALTGFGWNSTFYLTDGFDVRASVGVAYLRSENEAIMQNGNKRVLDFHVNDMNIDLGMGAGSGGLFYNINFGMNSRVGKLFASYVFADGSESYGLDHKMNGYYKAWRLTPLLGVTVGVPLGSTFQLVGRVDYVFDVQEDETYRASFDDLSDYKQDNSKHFPQDVHKYASDPFDQFNNTYNDFKGFRFTLALQFSIEVE